jgi:DNA-damage-inducible protein D
MADLTRVKTTFYSKLDAIKIETREGAQIWYARQIQEVLGYARWENFSEVIGKARMACEASGVEASNHFRDVTKKVAIGSGAQVDRADCIVSRYACYLIAMNGDSSKEEIALAQTYFAVQARRQEIRDEGDNIEKRMELRDRVTVAFKELGHAAKDAGVQNYGVFHDAGYRGLYGMNLRSLKAKKGLGERDALFDRAGRAELAANEFRMTQAEERLRTNRINTQRDACLAHEQVGLEVRKAMERIGGTMPEELPLEPSLKAIEKTRAKRLKKEGS